MTFRTGSYQYTKKSFGTRSNDRVPQILVEHTGFEPVTSTMRM